jgi:hypothetical protein
MTFFVKNVVKKQAYKQLMGCHGQIKGYTNPKISNWKRNGE